MQSIIARSGAQLGRNLNQTRRNVSGLVNKPNTIAQKQKQFTANPHLHGADNPTWLKGDTDKTTFLIGATLVGLGTLQLARGFWNMAWGVGKE